MNSIFVCENVGCFNHTMPRYNRRVYLSTVHFFIPSVGSLELFSLSLARNAMFK